MRPLDDVNVVSLGQIYNGPYCALMLAYLGADVVKVEPPGGENIRSRDEEGFTPEVVMLNSSKRSLTLDLKAERGKELFRELAREADVVVENYAPGVMDRLGLGYETLSEEHPELVYAHGSGYGESGRYTDYPAMDLTIQAMGGVMDVTGFPENPPVKAGVQVADFLGGIHLAAGVLSALYQRERTGEGQFVEVSMLDAIYPTLMSSVAAYYRRPDAPPRTGNRHSGLAVSPYNVYETDDGYVAIICVNERHWERLTELMDREALQEDPRFATSEQRAAHMDAVDELVGAWSREWSRDDLAETLLDAGIPCAPVKEHGEVIHDPHLEERGMVNELDHPEFGEIRVPGLPIRLHDADDPELRPAPGPGQDSEAVLGALGLSESEIDRLREEDVI
jgi:crotonobetainyl-CoA:carnitine CoA-transferase CaiB-like acyl-CoA transferase